MRNRITWKGFGVWLKTQRNSNMFEICNSKKCPVAKYVNSVFGVNNTEVATHRDIVYVINGVEVSVTAPKIFTRFIDKFDADGKNHERRGAKTVLAIYKEINQEEGII